MNSAIEIIKQGRPKKGQIKAAIFDFDGTVSTLRQGWEKVMLPMMMELIGGGQSDEALCRRVEEYIGQSTGIQTVYQMRWLAEQVKNSGRGIEAHDEWWYKEEYNRRLMLDVNGKLKKLEEGALKQDDFIINGAVEFLMALRGRSVRIYLASGTDHGDVVREAGALGLAGCFDYVRGAPERKADCSKEAVLRMILEEDGLSGGELLLVGDGKVEIAHGAAHGAYALGAATDEEKRAGVNPVKRERLVAAGANAIVGDFQCWPSLLKLLGVGE